jgi:hypothetical protein
VRARDQLISALFGDFALGVVVMCRLPGPSTAGEAQSNVPRPWRPAHHDRAWLQSANIYVQLGWTSRVYYSVFVFRATPAVESASLLLNLFNVLDGAPIEVAHANLEPLTLL